jgi:hypothetical protein
MKDFEEVVLSIRDYINLNVKNIEDIEMVTFSLSFHRTSEDEFTVGHPVIHEIRFEDINKIAPSSEHS